MTQMISVPTSCSLREVDPMLRYTPAAGRRSWGILSAASPRGR